MKTASAFIPTALAAALLYGCIPITIRYSPTYCVKTANAAPSIAIQISGQTSIDYQYLLDSRFGNGNPNQLIYAFFKSQLAKRIFELTIYKKVMFDTAANQPEFSREVLKIPGRDDLVFRMPVKGSIYSMRKCDPDFILHISNLLIALRSDPHLSKADKHGNPEYAGEKGLIRLCQAGITDWEGLYGQYFPSQPQNNFPSYIPEINYSKDLLVEAAFILWDNRQAEAVCCGLVSITDYNRNSISMEDWYSAMSKFAEKMFAGSPFAQR
jgi:hypothetical protein